MTKKALWTQLPNAKVSQPKKRKRIPAMSEKRKRESVVYRRLVKDLLKRHPYCFACHVKRSTQNHHFRGRAGKLYLDVRYFRAVCFPCHTWIGNNIELARQRGWIAKKGDWGRQD